MADPTLDAVDRELALLMRPLAKATPGRLPRASQNADALERYRAAIDLLVSHGWSWRRIARELEAPVTTIQAMYDGDRYVSTWALDNLPMDAQHVIESVRIAQLRRKAG